MHTAILGMKSAHILHIAYLGALIPYLVLFDSIWLLIQKRTSFPVRLFVICLFGVCHLRIVFVDTDCFVGIVFVVAEVFHQELFELLWLFVAF